MCNIKQSGENWALVSDFGGFFCVCLNLGSLYSLKCVAVSRLLPDVVFSLNVIMRGLYLSVQTQSWTNKTSFTRVSRQVEDQPGEKREQHAGNDDVDDEVKRQPQHQEMVGDVEVWSVGAAGVVNPVFPAPVVL